MRELEAQIRSGAFSLLEVATREIEKSLRGTAPLPALRGQLHTCRIVEGSQGPEDLRLDLGFGIHLAQSLETLRVRPGDVVAGVRSRGPAFALEKIERSRVVSYYSFSARIIRVVDADTVILDIDCGFRVWTRQRVRLRAIDAPELITPKGRRAKDFVIERLPEGATVAVTATRPDKYDRYLADIFYLKETGSAEEALREGVFLNRELLKAGMAERYFRG